MRKFGVLVLMTVLSLGAAGCSWLCCDPCEEDCCGCGPAIPSPCDPCGR